MRHDREIADALFGSPDPAVIESCGLGTDRQRPLEASGDGIRLVSAATVEPERITWAWDGRVPLGMVTLLVGQGGRGKSTLLFTLAAAWSRGLLAGDLRGEPVHVAIASSEDHRSAVIIPRLTAAGADLEYVHFVEHVVDGHCSDIELNGRVDELERVLSGKRARILLIDTLVSHIPSQHDTFKEQHVRRVLAPVHHMAERNATGVIAAMHLNRRDQHDVLTRISGSAGFGNLARSVLLLGDDPDDPDGPDKLLAHGKTNVGPYAPTLRVRIGGAEVSAPTGETIPTSRLSFLGEVVGMPAAQLLATTGGAEDRRLADEVEDALRHTLADGRVEAAKARASVMRETGASSRTVDTVKRRTGTVSVREGFGPGSKCYWVLPPLTSHELP